MLSTTVSSLLGRALNLLFIKLLICFSISE
jgi:hypothetical protein